MNNKMLFTALLFTGLTIVGARVNVSIPLSPVPFILSDFFIILGALYLGSKWAVISAGLYLLLGAAGLPVFSDGAGGLQHFYGPTGGYLIGFLVAAIIIGKVSEQKPQTVIKDIFAWFTGAVFLFVFGVSGLVIFAKMGFPDAVNAGFLPFIPAATIKGLTAVLIAGLLRRRDLLKDAA